jgi:hypothetical protein
MLEIISCSRRTDVPAFYYGWLQECLKNKYVMVKNPYNQVDYGVDLAPEKVHSISLWSKSFANVIKDPAYLSNYDLYFQFTITGYGKLLEPYSITAGEAVGQMEKLAVKYSPAQINWRFDPIILGVYKGKDALHEIPESERLKTFENLSRDISSIGVKKCTISFLQLYKKVERRMAASGILYRVPDEQEQIEIVRHMAEIADKYGITIYTCSSPIIEGVKGVKKGHCIDGAYLEELFGKKVSHAKDSGQRPGCGCTRSRDIGSYEGQRCGFGCRYCYAM